MIEGYRRCCGMDIHKDTIVVCVLPAVGTEGQKFRKTFGTFRNDLIRMRVWLKQVKVNEVAMESTGVYWRPVWNVLEEHGFRLLLVNPAQVRRSPDARAMAGTRSGLPSTCRMAGWTEVSFPPPRSGNCE